jgi:hypothetical protein
LVTSNNDFAGRRLRQLRTGKYGTDFPVAIHGGNLGSSAASANTPEFAIEPRIFLLDPLSQGAFLGLDLVDAYNLVMGWWQIEELIVLLDALFVELDLAGARNIILGWLPMIDLSLDIPIGGLDSGVLLGFRSVRRGGRRRQDNNSNENRAHGLAPPN